MSRTVIVGRDMQDARRVAKEMGLQGAIVATRENLQPLRGLMIGRLVVSRAIKETFTKDSLETLAPGLAVADGTVEVEGPLPIRKTWAERMAVLKALDL